MAELNESQSCGPKAHVSLCHMPHMYRHIVEGLPAMLMTMNLISVPWKAAEGF